MARILLAGILLLAICSPALAQQAQAWDTPQNLIQLAVTLLGMVVAARLASDAFARRPVPVADVPTFPKYMTSRMQYRIGSWIFIVFACGIFLLLVYFHRDVANLSTAVGGDVIPKGLLDAVKDQSASYLTIIAAMGAVYLYLLTKETQWNVLLIMRDLIYRWISIPQLAGQIVAQIRFSLHVPQDAVAAVIASSDGVVEQDFRKDTNTPDRLWAETCYMKWWLTQGHKAGEDATFFTEESFGFDKLLGELEQTSRDLIAWKSGKSGAPANLALAGVFDNIKDLHNRFSRLVACYLIYRNSSRKELCAEAGKFGLEIKDTIPQYPLRYWIVYVIVLSCAVYVGVYASAIACDWVRGQGFDVGQDPQRALQWIMYSLSNFGLAIVAIQSVPPDHVLLDFSCRIRCWSARAEHRRPLFLARPKRGSPAPRALLRHAQMGLGTGAHFRLHLLLSRPADIPRPAQYRTLCGDYWLASRQLLWFRQHNSHPDASLVVVADRAGG
jgi:hypothetical protein